MVRRPRLTPELLKKPPFRFLHDVISEVRRAPAGGGGRNLFFWFALVGFSVARALRRAGSARCSAPRGAWRPLWGAGVQYVGVV